MISIVLAEDSAVTREYLVHLLDSDPALEVIGQGRDGGDAVELVEALRPDVVVMDVEMPNVDGYQATRLIMERVPTPIVMVSAHSSHFDAKAFDALQAGALVLLNKPPGPGQPGAAAGSEALLSTVKLMAEVKVVRRWAERKPAGRTEAAPVRPRRAVRAIAVGASAGGPPVVAEILAALPRDLPCPILLVQHIAAGFTSGLADWLGRSTGLDVKLADADEYAAAGTVYVAPDDVQMGMSADGRIRLSSDGATDGFRPSASYLLSSVARSHGAAAIGVLLTGMGRDGASGLLELRERGGVTIAQNKESSVVFGMPMEAIRLGAAEHVLSPVQIAETILALTKPRGGADTPQE